MEEIKVGEYIRTMRGNIGQFKSYGKGDDTLVYFKNGWGLTCVDRCEIVKHSENIIDLIQCGDYVNGGKVVEIDASKDWIDNSEEDTVLRQEDIKTIVTKEQFSSVEYRLEEGDK